MTVVTDIVAAVKSLPPLSDSAGKLLEVMNTGRHTAVDVAKAVEMDPTLTAKVLRIVNSPVYGLRLPVESVGRAVAYLGDKTVLGIALESGAGDLYKKPLTGYETGDDTLWAHSLYTAIGARELSRYSREVLSPDIAYTAGLLHDIGKAVIDAWLVGQAKEIVQLADASQKSFDESERECLGTSHAQVGGLVMARWGLPESLRHAATFHHAPRSAPQSVRGLVYAVHLGDFLAMMGGVGTGADTLLYALDPDYATYFSLEPDELERITLAIEDEYRKVMAAMSGC
ncbi:HDOD domain-containing protein [Desulfonatronum thioautotrophicum]|uniref:HDOD domain-containing protein n=1 Tax=Desulfonatronum thioautotrophicum TaxID=617001 RepID=UPI0005EBD98F|nr:HDOD domain-containing protein [Desulfonatronum thioautotrophicum]